MYVILSKYVYTHILLLSLVKLELVIPNFGATILVRPYENDISISPYAPDLDEFS